MFNSNKKNNYGSRNSESSNLYSSYEGVPIHTMQDDINSLSGAVAPKKNLKEKSYSEINFSGKETTPGNNSFAGKPSSLNAPKSYSPFLNAAAPQSSPDLKPSSIPQSAQISQKQPVEKIIELPKKGLKWSKILIFSASLAAILALAAGGYYFWITRAPAPQPPLPSDGANNQIPNVPPVIVEPQVQKYSLDKPNYLPIDTEAASKSIQDSIAETASEIQEENIAVPVEFVVVDKDNDPIDFSIFTIHAGMKLSGAVENLDNAFSLFIYSDAGNPRLGLAIDLKDKQKAVSAMSVQEKTIVGDLGFLFLGNTPQKTGRSFKENFHNNNYIRYINIDPGDQGALSIDYAFAENKLIIATSKNAMWAILDKLSPETEKTE